MDIYAAAVQVMKPSQISHKRSDLYLLMTWQILPYIREYRKNGGTVYEIESKDTGLYYYYIPYGYTLYWHKKLREAVEKFAWEFIRVNETLGTMNDWSDENFTKTFAHMKTPPHEKFYDPIRITLHSILSAYAACPNPLLACS